MDVLGHKECKRSRKHGFTMAELLMVVAIIAVLVAIAIPVFSTQLKNSRLAVDHAAMRDAYALVQIANNTREVSIEGRLVSFDELDKATVTGTGAQYFCLSKDCSTFIRVDDFNNLPEGLFLFTEEGSVAPNGCDTCLQWGGYASWSHFKGRPISISYYTDSGMGFQL